MPFHETKSAIYRNPLCAFSHQVFIDAAAIFKQYLYDYRDRLSAGIILAGYDEFKGGQVYMLPLGGYLKRQSIAIGGSGSTWIYGHVDNTYVWIFQKDDLNF